MPKKPPAMPKMSPAAFAKMVTVWGKPTETINKSCYGTVTFLRWCQLEMQRLNRKHDDKGRPENVRLIEDKATGYIALSR